MNRPALISVFSDQRRTKSTTRSRTSCGTHTLVRAPQDFFLRPCAQPSIRPAPHPSSGSSFPGTRSTWSTFEQARAAYETGMYDGVGLVQSDTVGVDLDNKSGPFDPQMLANLRLNTYAERSPSGGGIRLIGYGELPRGRNRSGSLELYDRFSARYLTITGDHIEGTPISINTCDFTELHSRMVAGEFGGDGGNGGGHGSRGAHNGNDESLSIVEWKLVGDVVDMVGREPDDIEQEF